MPVYLDCIPCLLKTSLSVARKVTNDPILIEKFFKKVLMIDALRRLKSDKTSPEVAEMIFLEALMLGPNKDPFLKVKEEQNRTALELYPWLKEIIEKSEDRFASAVKLSIASNLMDSVAGTDAYGSKKEEIKKVLSKDLSPEDLATFRKKVESSEMILYLGDNSGEIVFDRLLIEIIKERTKVDVIFVVRSEPTYNDVTLKEAFAVGMERLATVIENGISGPLPGTIIPRCSTEMKKLFKKADLVISKGGGNFESMAMGSPWQMEKDTTFLTIAKCIPYCLKFGINMSDPILKNAYKALEKPPEP